MRVLSLILLPWISLVISGCFSSSTKDVQSDFALGDMIEDPYRPDWSEVEAAEWVDKPVRDAIDAMRSRQAELPPPELSVEEALAARNEYPENPEINDQILRTLGQMPPVDEAKIEFDSTFVRHVAGDLKSTNPIMVSSTTEFEYAGLTGFEYLSFDDKFDYFAPADTVVSWQQSADGLMDKFVLRDDLAWSDGEPITARDIAFTFEVIMSSKVNPPAVRTGTSELRNVVAYDDRTVVFFHKEPRPTNVVNMIFPTIPQHVYADELPKDPGMNRSKFFTNLEDNPVVGGRYELVKRNRNQEFVFERREGYYMHEGEQVRDQPYFKQIRVKVIEDSNTALNALIKGDIDEMMLRAEHWVGQAAEPAFYENNKKVTGLEWTEFHFVWNMKTPLFADKKVRWAMSYAMDYEELLQVICYGLYQPPQGTFHPNSWMFPDNGPEPLKQDLEKAKSLLAEAGWSDTDRDGILDKEINGRRVKFEFSLMTYQTDNGKKVATLLKECLNKIGIVCNVKPTEFTQMQQAHEDHKFQASMGGWGTSTDPDSSYNLFGTGENRNYAQYSNPEVDQLFEQARRELDRTKRAEMYGKIHMLLWEDQPYTWLFYRNGFYAFNKKLRGYNFSPRGPYDYSPGSTSLYVPAATP